MTNNGPNSTDDIITNDPGLIQADITGHATDNGTFDEATRTWTIPHLASGETATLTVSVLVSSAASGNYHNLVAIQESRVPDPRADNNTATADLFVPAADIAVTKTVDNPTPTLGATVTFTVGVRNRGPDAAPDVTVTDLLPAGLTYLTSSASQGTYDPGTGVWTVGSLEPEKLRLPPATRHSSWFGARVTRVRLDHEHGPSPTGPTPSRTTRSSPTTPAQPP